MQDIWGFTSTPEVLHSAVSWWHWCNGITEVWALEDPAGTLCLLNQTRPNTSCALVKYDILAAWLIYMWAHLNNIHVYTHSSGLVKYHLLTCEWICMHTVILGEAHHRPLDESVITLLNLRRKKKEMSKQYSSSWRIKWAVNLMLKAVRVTVRERKKTHSIKGHFW